MVSKIRPWSGEAIHGDLWTAAAFPVVFHGGDRDDDDWPSNIIPSPTLARPTLRLMSSMSQSKNALRSGTDTNS